MVTHRRMKQLRGKKVDIPVLDDGELGIVMDKKEVFVGVNEENLQILTSTSTVNSLTSTSTTLPLSANKGKELKAEIDSVSKKLAADISDLDDKLNQKAPTQLASSTSDGLMSKEDKIKLDGIEEDVNKTIVVNNLTSTSTTSALSAKQGSTLNQNIQGVNTNLLNHNNKIVSSETGVHGVRYYGNQLQVNNPATNRWDTITVSNGGSDDEDVVIADGSITFNKLEIPLQTRINNFIKLSDIPIVSATKDGLMTTADKAKLNALPTTMKQVDVVDNLTSTYTDKALSAYQGKLLRDMISSLGYTGSDGGGDGGTGSGEIVLTEGDVYGIAIDQSKFSPSDSVTYTNHSLGFVSGAAWDDIFPFNEITPVLLNAQGVETAILNKSDFTKDKNGNSVNITSGDNVMIRIPKIWYNIETIGNVVYVKIARKKITTHYRCYAHTIGNIEKDYIYISAYLGSLNSNKLKSWSGKKPYEGSLDDCRTYAQANGQGYNLIGFHQLTLIKILALLRSKTLDSQSYYGIGYNSDLTNLLFISTGVTNNAGMYFNSRNDIHKVKIMGIEDFYGYLGYWIDGIKTDESFNFRLSLNNKFNNNSDGYITYSSNIPTYMSGYIKRVQGSTERGFLPRQVGGTGDTYFTDWADVYPSAFLNYGKKTTSYDYEYETSGLFRMCFQGKEDISCARIMYL